MIIRRKDNHAKTQSVEELQYPFYRNGKSYRWHNEDTTAGVYHSYSDEEWEEVPAEKWVLADACILNQRTMRVIKRAVWPIVAQEYVDFTLPDDMRFQYHPGGGICVEGRIK